MLFWLLFRISPKFSEAFDNAKAYIYHNLHALSGVTFFWNISENFAEL